MHISLADVTRKINIYDIFLTMFIFQENFIL